MSDQAIPATRGLSFDTALLGHYSFEQSPLPMVAVEGPTHIVRRVNHAFARLVGKTTEELVGHPFAEIVPEGTGDGSLALLDRVFGTGIPENLAEAEHRQPSLAYWSYSAWAIFGEDGRPAGVMIQVTDSTGTAHFRHQAAAVNEALVLSSVRQHELVDATESLNVRLREAHDQLEERVAERTAELASALESLESEMARRRDLARRLATAQEDERRRVARDLHDTVGQLVAGLSLAFKAIETGGELPPPAAARLAAAQQVMNDLSREVHGLAVRLRPTSLDDIGLEAALEHLVAEWSSRTGVRADFYAAGLERLPGEVETAVYRIVQEALTNVAKHAGATVVSVVVTRPDEFVSVVVEDNGTGFDPDAVPKGRLGLMGMRERVELVGGEIDIGSSPGAGTTIAVRIPVTKNGDGS
jgi:PAS domain S-box-containing protein